MLATGGKIDAQEICGPLSGMVVGDGLRVRLEPASGAETPNVRGR
jgi:hypothetical protein